MVNAMFPLLPYDTCTIFSLSSSTDRLHIQFCLHCHKEDLRLCSRDSSDHQKDCGGRENWQHYRQGTFSHFTQTDFEAIMRQCVKSSDIYLSLSNLCIFRLFWEISRRSKKSLCKRRNPKNQVKSEWQKLKENFFIHLGPVKYFLEIIIYCQLVHPFMYTMWKRLNWGVFVLYLHNRPLKLTVERGRIRFRQNIH